MRLICRVQVCGDTEIARELNLEELGSIPRYGTQSQSAQGTEALLIDAFKKLEVWFKSCLCSKLYSVEIKLFYGIV